ncbi:hypothetical protein CWE04_11180 [Thomasclavelia cocleata]|uniref:Uncharacterized protein n=1 Tax=Thomasclavelia cocleata TaxID=69824 RepID=A0A1I0BDL3_9FIRM|nr:hypothetical protein [Thomasclavelia cocleata]MCR1959910.1 hypothetical protein [Thomasclavelia cocleata]NDO41744.1 hypothetical protein [Thomasclavelia cocleata]PJN79774.1 hypothetical protein CWE04_11180 [Thomasclavelia cocleata]SET05036.1 hypothetical protein SAMN04489758_10183 [Thomasclavelia cocleata]
MSYPCIENFFKECDSCGLCNNIKPITCPKCGEELINGDELFFEEFSDNIIGCTKCIYVKNVEDYACEET